MPTPTDPGRPGSPAPFPATPGDASQAPGGPPPGYMPPPGYGRGYYPPPPPRRRMGFWGWAGWIGLAIVLFSLISRSSSSNSGLFSSSGQIEERTYQSSSHPASAVAKDKVAIITVDGVITHEDGFAKYEIDQAMNDPAVKAVVLRVDSPGGTVTGSNYLWHHLTELAKQKKINIVVSMGAICASGGYYISMAVGDTPDSIYAEPTTWTGSIGVVIPHYDLSGLLAKWNVSDDSIVSNPLKLTGSPTYKATGEIADKQRKILQVLVDESFKDFKDIVKSGRPKFKDDEAKLDAVATGQVYTAKQAKDAGLVDQIGYLDDAIDQAIKLNKLNKDDVRIVQYAKPKGLLSDVLGGGLGQSRQPGLTLDGLLEMASPRAYYLWTALPVLTAAEGRQ